MKYQKLKQAIIEANSEIMELKFGCKVWIRQPKGEPSSFESNDGSREEIRIITINNDEYMEYDGCDEYPFCDFKGLSGWIGEDEYSLEYKILGRPIQLPDVLIAIEKNTPDTICYSITTSGEFSKEDTRYGIPETTVIWWDLTKTFDNQSDETKMWLEKILVK